MPCTRGMKVATGEPKTGCRAACLHRLLVDEHRIDRHNWELMREEASNGHATEAEEFEAKHPGPTFKARLIANKRPEPADVESIERDRDEAAA